MISPEYVRTMAAYGTAMNASTFAAAATLDDAARRAERGAFWGSIHGTLNHILWADRMWMSRFAGWEKPAVVQRDSAGLIADFDALAAARTKADADITAWAHDVTPAWLAEDLVWFSGGSQAERRQNRGLLVMHLFNHGTHHRGQAHTLLMQCGRDVGVTDLPWVTPK